MRITCQPIMGMHVGFELFENTIEGNEIGYLLVDLFILRIQFAWYKN